MKIDNIEQLQVIAKDARRLVLEAIYSANSGHPGGSLSCIDILVALYFKEMNIDENNPSLENRDRFILSKGHASAALYSVLSKRGFFNENEIKNFRHLGSFLQGHPDMKKVPGVDMTTGSLGQGLSASVGMALSGKAKNQDYKVYCLLGDGEIEEGQVWEAAMSASHYKLDNLIAIIDNNNLQIDGYIKDVMSPYPIDEKFKSFGFEIINIDGHDFNEIIHAFERAKKVKGKPTAIIAKTVKGKGISFMENRAEWHGKVPSQEQYNKAIDEWAVV